MICTWHEARGSDPREARWVVEVHGADGENRQRLAACDKCAREVFRLMKWDIPMRADSYSTIRRAFASDAVLTFDSLAGED